MLVPCGQSPCVTPGVVPVVALCVGRAVARLSLLGDQKIIFIFVNHDPSLLIIE